MMEASIKWLREQEDHYSQHLVRGVADITEYWQLVGLVRGYREAREKLEDIMKAIEDDV